MEERGALNESVSGNDVRLHDRGCAMDSRRATTASEGLMISVLMSSNEQGSSRAAGLANALHDDSRFEWGGYGNIPVDLQFHSGDSYFNVELKECSDYIASTLGPSGHLYQQVLTMRELGHPCMVLVLGSDEDITNAIKDATKTRYKGQERAYQIGSYNDRLLDFEANSEALGCRVTRWKANPWKRLLSTVHKVMTGGNLLSYRPKPANGERQKAALCMLVPGIGEKKATALLEKFGTIGRIYECANGDYGEFQEIPGIGDKLAYSIHKALYFKERSEAMA